MAKRGRSHKKESKNFKRRHNDYVEPEDMDDEIDAFHKNRDIIPLDVNANADESSDDYEEPIFDDKDIDEDSDDLEEDNDDDIQDTGFAAKLARQQKFLREKFGGVGDDMDDDGEEEDDEKKIIWGGRKAQYYGGDNHDYEIQSSDDEAPDEEEAEVLRLQKEKAKSFSMEDFGIEDVDEDESDRELTLEEIPVKGKVAERTHSSKGAEDDMGTTVEEVKKDLGALSAEEKMEIVYSSAPEVVGLLSEFNDALEQLENKVNPLLIEAKLSTTLPEGGIRYLEVKQLLLLVYCQAITFYLLLKSEGQPVRDHPVLAHLVDIKGLLDKMKQLDGNLPSEFEEFVKKYRGAEVVESQSKESDSHQLVSGTISEVGGSSLVSVDEHELAKHNNVNGLENKESKGHQNKERKHKSKRGEVGVQSLEMLKIRAALEEKLKQNGVISSVSPKPDKGKKYLKPVNRHLATYDDFDDDALNAETDNHGVRSSLAESLGLHKISEFTTKLNKPKTVSGDDDLPKRDDVGERRRKHELRVLAGAGIKSEDDNRDENDDVEGDGDSDTAEDGDTEDSADDFYERVKQTRAAKLAAKGETYKRTSTIPSLPETVDGKRQISYQIEKNRGLTRPRKKLTKNPRKKYRTKHDKALKRRKGQVREVRKPTGSYGGEAYGINTRISRSIRL